MANIGKYRETYVVIPLEPEYERKRKPRRGNRQETTQKPNVRPKRERVPVPAGK